MNTITFTAVIQSSKIGKGGAYIEFPFSTKKIFGKDGRIKVKCMFDTEAYRGSLVRMETQCHIIGVKKEILQKLGKTIGDSIDVTISEDTEERTIELHGDIQKERALNPLFKERFDALSYTQRKEWNEAIRTAKKEETRMLRIKKMITDILSD